ncbi:hypothetical protein [Parapedobacter indicus]|uniref:Uncharacterized protein n=1 Tax=Parapedobacter indicus TaxID=1477437 RepID=A0A1I3FZ32_9SPHI|nr:hypothetical protein [Parapedobacter indicus]PPL03957.1 hypothetical protein CLV26_102565 [Parapedobacter indicus]SFI16490.1 hypothetical protein SAMN05444682_102565 [Parapedobacter indicus]
MPGFPVAAAEPDAALAYLRSVGILPVRRHVPARRQGGWHDGAVAVQTGASSFVARLQAQRRLRCPNGTTDAVPAQLSAVGNLKSIPSLHVPILRFQT